MLAYPPPTWGAERITLYHGTVARYVPSILDGIDLRVGRANLDFGRGFYTTTLLRQAVFWADALWRRSPSLGEPAVVAFDVNLDELSRLDTLAFVRSHYEADRFWGFVWWCRQFNVDHGRATHGGWHDVVVGPVAANWKQRVAMNDFEQVSFHTLRAGSLLNASRAWRVV